MSIEQTYIAKNGTKVIYRHKKRKYDFNHVIFVFSGFLNAKPGNYDFANALNDCPCDVVWICDNFEDMYAYYMCINMDFRVEEAVAEFMQHILDSLSLDISQSTTTGFSKGGSAALYYGLKYNIPNIVTTVPQMHIGSYVHNYWKHVATHMMGGNYGVPSINYLDRLLPRMIKTDTNRDRNIYLLTSEADKQYKPEIEPYLQDFAKYNNFNLLKTYSAFVREHNQVTGHHTALLLGIYYALASEAVPRYSNGEVNFFGSQPHSNPNPSGETYVDLRVLRIVEDRLFIDGVALLRGYDVAEYSDLSYELKLDNGQELSTLPLAKGNQPHVTKQLFDGQHLTIYDKAVFTTYQHKGVDLSELSKGTYKLSVEIKLKNGITAFQDIKNERGLQDVESGRYKVFAKDNIFYLDVE